ncbi:hypothetical protein NLI96_g10857 [Meripilus lineatus]|uniref:Pentatricopeptide repeat-containing protein n=1 Tax=Meripilus lineatus TaxID=2056292 RepID=A0AAD5UXC1_9APHY|nr:hypothetical protein NLI96_g10857 [Physisporinus lineatus]
MFNPIVSRRRLFAYMATPSSPDPQAHELLANRGPSSGSVSDKPSFVAQDAGSLPIRPMTSAQMSRAAAEAVRLCSNDGQFTPALFVVNSLHRSTKKDAMLHTYPEPLHPSDKDMEPIDFGQPVSPRLSAHCLLHALIRAGHTTRATRLSSFMMHQGIRVRTASNEAIISALCGTQSPSSQTFRLQHPPPRIDTLRPSLRSSNPNTQAAIRITQFARRFGQSRTSKMYSTIISTCIMQGEIIVASLLFVLLVKDWQARSNSVPQEPAHEEQSSQSRRSASGLPAVPYPSTQLRALILRDVEKSYSNILIDPGGEPHFQDSLQALANLASLVEEGLVHTSSISHLIRALYSCPKGDHQVWISRGETRKLVKAYPYFQRVLMRILGSFKGTSQHALKLPRLDTRSYNTLLSYSLRHRLSPALASEVLDHMLTVRKPPLEPDIVTLNILLRSSTLLRKRGIVEGTLATIFEQNHPIPPPDPTGKTKDVEPMISEEHHAGAPFQNHRPSSFILALQGLRTQRFTTPDLAMSAFATLRADSYTLVSYISHLVSTGQPHLVGDLLFHFLPELNIIDHPANGSQSNTLRKANREACLKRSVAFGPQFFAVVLNALVKAGRTGLAERVWILANTAQRASWVPGFVPDVKPWALSIHAYTSMMQCYASEATTGVPRLFRGKLPREQSAWIPRSKQHVRGWARYVLKSQGSPRPSNRSTAGRRMGLLLFRSMIDGGRDIYKSLRALDQIIADNPSLRLNAPLPDARFFNAALDLFSRWPGMIARAPRGSRSRWERRFRISNRIFEQRGEVQRNWSPELQEIASAMVASKYTIPIGFRHLFIGRWFYGVQPHSEKRIRINQAPYAFPPPRYRFRPHGLPTHKTRGLPIKRHRCTRRRRNIRM